MKENNKAVKTVSLIFFATAFSKIAGLIRRIVMAYLYGGSMENSAITIALEIPLGFFDIFFGAAILGVFIPVYNSFAKDTNATDKSEEFANVFLSFVILATGLLVLVGMIFAPQIVDVMATGYSEETKRLTVNLLRIMLPMIVFTGFVFTLTGVLHSKGEFLAPALVSAFSNLCVIGYFIFLDGYFGIYGLAIAYLVSWSIQLLTLIIPLYKKRFKYNFKIDFKNQAFLRALKTALPILAGAWLIPMSRLIAYRFSSLFEIEDYNLVIAAFDVSWTVFFIVTGVLAYSVCNYIFPKLAQNVNDEHEFVNILKNGISGLIFVIAPVAVLAFVLRDEAIAVLFMRGEFTPDIAQVASQMFMFLAPAMLTFSMIELLNRVFYSKNLVKFPMLAAISAIAVNFVLCYIFVEVMGFAPAFITLANLICQSVALFILASALKLNIRGVLNKKLILNIAKIVLSSGFSLIITITLYSIIGNNAFESGILGNILIAVIILIAGAAAYLCANFVLRTNESRFILKMLKR